MNRDEIKNYLTENPSVAIDVAHECNSWDGSFPEFDTWYLSDMVDCMCGDHKSTMKFLEDIISAAESGEFNYHSTDCDFIRYDDLGNLEIRSQDELEEEVVDYIDEIVDKLEEEYPHNVDVYDDELKELLETTNEEESENE